MGGEKSPPRKDHMSYETYVLKYNDQFCRFSSYSEMRLVDSPLKATQYARLYDAKNKRDDSIGYYEGHTRIAGSSLTIVKVEMELTREEVVT